MTFECAYQFVCRGGGCVSIYRHLNLPCVSFPSDYYLLNSLLHLTWRMAKPRIDWEHIIEENGQRTFENPLQPIPFTVLCITKTKLISLLNLLIIFEQYLGRNYPVYLWEVIDFYFSQPQLWIYSRYVCNSIFWQWPFQY